MLQPCIYTSNIGLVQSLEIIRINCFSEKIFVVSGSMVSSNITDCSGPKTLFFGLE